MSYVSISTHLRAASGVDLAISTDLLLITRNKQIGSEMFANPFTVYFYSDNAIYHPVLASLELRGPAVGVTGNLR